MRLDKSHERVRLRDWLKLQDIYEQITNAVDIEDVADLIQLYISTALLDFNIDENSWVETIEVWDDLSQLNRPSLEFPILNSKIKDQVVTWDYEGRTWYLWLHLFSGQYGWDIDYIANLEIDVAIGLMQEILISDQLQREWEWQRSEIAFPYNSATKKQEFKPLDRPVWMQPVFKETDLQLREMPESFRPVGNVIRSEIFYEKYKNIKH